MPQLKDIMRDLEDKIDDLQRDTKFCINNYDYHHKNNEYELLKKFQVILDECLPDGREFHKNMKNFKVTIEEARKKCLDVDDMLKEFGGDNTGNLSSTGHSVSFREEEHACAVAEGNKENIK